MSEYQYICFRAIDMPVSKTNLAFMREQSSRAKITPWSFENEYEFGDFHGDAIEMLRRGYDFHFHYSNFGDRKLMMRFPTGFPGAEAARPYFSGDSLNLLNDKNGLGCILHIEPFFEAGQLDDIWDLDNLVDRLLPLQAEILGGDLRPLYLAHLAVSTDGNHYPSKIQEAPVPAGLGKLSAAQRALTELYGLDKHLVEAAARESPSLLERPDSDKRYADWVQRLPSEAKDAWLVRLLENPDAGVRREMLSEYQKTNMSSLWPTALMRRTIRDSMTAAEELESQHNRKRAKHAAAERAEKLAEMAAHPSQTLAEIEPLLAQRSAQAYHQIAALLAELRHAVAGTEQAALAETQARLLKEKYPTLRKLLAELRLQGFLKR